MSLSEAKRFADDLVADRTMAAELKDSATGLASVVDFAKERGYDFNVDEAKDFIQSRTPKELTDEQLDAVAGGKSHSSTSSTTVQTAGVATSAAEAAEVATSAVQVAEAAADVAAAAEIVAVAAAVLT
nr:Nif11-like leader peptide family natural product precursor [Acuticoccus kandeliae]